MLHLHNTLRNKYKKKFKDQLILFKNSKKYQDIRNKLNLNDYDFVMSQSKHKDEALSLMSRVYAKKNMFPILYDSTSNDTKDILRARCEFVCDYGRMICAINSKTGELVGATVSMDLCDKNEVESQPLSRPTKLHQYISELFQFIYENKNDKLIPIEMNKLLSNDIKTEEEIMSLYGKYTLVGMTFVDNNPSIFVMLLVLLFELIHRTGYTYGIGEATNIQLHRMCQIMDTTTVSTIPNLKQFKFSDGTNIDYHLNEYAKKYGIKAMRKLEQNLVFYLIIFPANEFHKQFHKMMPVLTAGKVSKL